MRLLLIILFSWCLSSSAQIIRANPYYIGALASGCANRLLDSFPSAAAAYSLRKLDKDYSGSAIRVRRSSDNTEQDIGFVSCGDLDTTSLKSFVGANNGFVVTWYDQSGNSKNVSQSTAICQPQIIASGSIYRINNLPSIKFDASNDSLSLGSSLLSGSSAATLYGVVKLSADPSSPANGHFVNNGGSANNSHYTFTDGVIYDDWASSARKTTGNPTTNLANTHLYCAISASSDWRSYINNVNHYTTGTNTFSATSYFTVGWDSSPSPGYGFNGYVSEIIVYSSASSNGDRTSISTNINNYYSIY